MCNILGLPALGAAHGEHHFVGLGGRAAHRHVSPLCPFIGRCRVSRPCLGLLGLLGSKSGALRCLGIAALPLIALWVVRMPVMLVHPSQVPMEIGGIPARRGRGLPVDPLRHQSLRDRARALRRPRSARSPCACSLPATHRAPSITRAAYSRPYCPPSFVIYTAA